jgi:hypothetical protein
MNIGDKVLVKAYDKHGEPILRPAEIAASVCTDQNSSRHYITQVRFLDEKFRKDGRSPWAEPVLTSKIILPDEP